MHSKRYCWQDYVIPRGWWIVDLSMTLLILAILTVSYIGDESADGASRAPVAIASIAPSECLTGKVTWARMEIGTDVHEIPEGKHQALMGRG